MNEGLNYNEFSEILRRVSREMKGLKDYLIELDLATGDGDLGITISHGFTAVEETIETKPESVSQLLIKSGIAFNNAAGSTMGALFGMALMRAGKEVRDNEQVDLQAFLKMIIGMETSIKEKGKAEVGDKTILDALVPARIALEKSLAENTPVLPSLEQAYLASAKGAENTKSMQATYGRSRWLGERTIGFVDPGAVFISLFFKAIWESYRQQVLPRPEP